MQKTGREQFTFKKSDTSFTIFQFWRWSYSNLLTNTLRGHLAEFIVATALGLDKKNRVEWDTYDLETNDGIKIEIKSAAYIQGWEQTRMSRISFNISPTQGWEAEVNSRSTLRKRQADLYIFCLLHHQDLQTVDPLSLDQWSFYLLPTSTLDSKAGLQKTMSMSSLLRFKPTVCGYDELQTAIRQITTDGL